MKVALFSYNSFVYGEDNGWKKGLCNEVLLIQDPENRSFAATQNGLSVAEMTEEANSMIDKAFTVLKTEVSELDRLIVYVGSYGAERVVELAKEYKVPKEKIAFVMCDCNLRVKEFIISKCGYKDSDVQMCGCGGNYAMKKLYTKYMETWTNK